MLDPSLSDRYVQSLFDISGSHTLTQPPGNDIPRIVIQKGREIRPTSVNNLHIRKISLSEFFDPGGQILKLICS